MFGDTLHFEFWYFDANVIFEAAGALFESSPVRALKLKFPVAANEVLEGCKNFGVDRDHSSPEPCPSPT